MKRMALPLSISVSALVCACEGVPTLTFAQPDARPDATDDGLLSASDGSVDGATAASDGSDDGLLAPTDAGVEGSCPPPASAQTPFVCCGTVTCEGQCAGQCVSCMNKCAAPGEFCCAKTNNVMCLSAGSICR